MKNNKESVYSVKVSVSPVMGYNCYSVFRDGELVFTIDGDCPYVFEDEVVDSFIVQDYKQYRIYKIDQLLFTGFLPLTVENVRKLPVGCRYYPAESEFAL